MATWRSVLLITTVHTAISRHLHKWGGNRKNSCKPHMVWLLCINAPVGKRVQDLAQPAVLQAMAWLIGTHMYRWTELGEYVTHMLYNMQSSSETIGPRLPNITHSPVSIRGNCTSSHLQVIGLFLSRLTRDSFGSGDNQHIHGRKSASKQGKEGRNCRTECISNRYRGR